MRQEIKQFIKKKIPARFLELVSYKAVTITKIPRNGSIISDLFILRMEDKWETHFELLQLDSLFNPGNEVVQNEVIFSFYSKEGEFLGEKKVVIPAKIKNTIIVNHVARDIDVSEDCLFAIFHSQKKQWINKFDSFIAERGYIGYENVNKGCIKGFVHGNLDAIARKTKKKKDQLLGNYSFFKKKYHLQHSLNGEYIYELYLVNPSSSKQTFIVTEIKDRIEKKTKIDIPSNGMYKYFKGVDKKNSRTNIIIETKLYLARPVVFKIMPSSFDVFHG